MDKESAVSEEQKPEEEAIEEKIVSAQPSVEAKTPSNRNIIIIIATIILIIAGIAYYLIMNPGIFGSKQSATVQQPPAAAEIISDPQIDKDIQALNGKMNSLDVDFNNIDYGLNDKPLAE